MKINIKFILILLFLILFFKNKIENFTINRPSKCFSCEKEIMNRVNIYNLWNALPNKCFDCEKQSNKPIRDGPTKCFSCDVN